MLLVGQQCAVAHAGNHTRSNDETRNNASVGFTDYWVPSPASSLEVNSGMFRYLNPPGGKACAMGAFRGRCGYLPDARSGVPKMSAR
jgi:hypothetical protein